MNQTERRFAPQEPTAYAGSLAQLALRLYFLFPAINLVLFPRLNGYLLARGVSRRDGTETARRRGRRRERADAVLGTSLFGIAIIGPLAFPLVDLTALVAAAALIVDLFKTLPREATVFERPSRGSGLPATISEQVSNSCSAASEAIQRIVKWQSRQTIWAFR